MVLLCFLVGELCLRFWCFANLVFAGLVVLVRIWCLGWVRQNSSEICRSRWFP